MPDGLQDTDGSAIRHRSFDGARRTAEDMLNEIVASPQGPTVWQRQRL